MTIEVGLGILQTGFKPRDFKKGDLVLRQTFDRGMFKPNWEGLYMIGNDGLKEAYKLQSPDGKTKPRPWNSTFLKKIQLALVCFFS